MNLKVKELLDILDIKAKNLKDSLLDIEVKKVSTDTRTIKEGELFIPIKGEKFDGHDYIDAAFEKGAILTLSEKKIERPSLIVTDTKQAYYKIAEYYREKINPKVIGITGSVGKTINKEIIARVLSKKYNVLKTQKNFNNEIGVAKTILNLKKKHEILVIEMGIDKFGEMTNLTKMAKPNIVVLTNIGLSHVGNFNSKNDIVKAKFEIFKSIKDDGFIIYNGDDKILKENLINIRYPKISFGYDKNNDVLCKSFKSKGINGSSVKIKTKKQIYKLNLKARGQHLGYSVMPAIYLSEKFNIKPKEVKKSLELYEQKDKRMEIIEIEKNKFICDCYNASLKSMRSSLDTLENTKTNRKKVAILGDILETGYLKEDIHKKVGDYIALKEIDDVILIGEASKYTYDELRKYRKKNLYYYNDKKEFREKHKKHKEALILLKASRGMKLEKIIEYYDGGENA